LIHKRSVFGNNSQEVGHALQKLTTFPRDGLIAGGEQTERIVHTLSQSAISSRRQRQAGEVVALLPQFGRGGLVKQLASLVLAQNVGVSRKLGQLVVMEVGETSRIFPEELH
jgi:hypothetical protein